MICLIKYHLFSVLSRVALRYRVCTDNHNHGLLRTLRLGEEHKLGVLHLLEWHSWGAVFPTRVMQFLLEKGIFTSLWTWTWIWYLFISLSVICVYCVFPLVLISPWNQHTQPPLNRSPPPLVFSSLYNWLYDSLLLIFILLLE